MVTAEAVTDSRIIVKRGMKGGMTGIVIGADPLTTPAFPSGYCQFLTVI
jgi:hypothetical protein